jgi:hypothetical protein
MVDRSTYLQNALYQIQEKGNPTRAVDIPPDTQERHVKNVRVRCVSASKTGAQSVVRLRRSASLRRPVPPTINSG